MDDPDRVIQRMLGEPTLAHLRAVAVRLQAEVDTLLARLAERDARGSTPLL